MLHEQVKSLFDESMKVSLDRLAPQNSDNLDLVKNYLATCQEGIRHVHEGGGTGLQVASLRTIVIDRLIKALFDLAGREYCLKYQKSDQKCTIVALGGYGRRELSPASDIDIMFLYPWKIGAYIETVIERVLYILWDTGLDIGYSTRNIDDCVKMSDDLVAKTSLVDSRFICGDEETYNSYGKTLYDKIFSKNVHSFIEEKVIEGEERRKKFGGSVYILEPNIKEGDGGLRDYHTALWAAKIRFRVDDFKALNIKGLINDREYDEVISTYDFMVRVRNDLHFLAGRKFEQLTFDFQEKIALNMGYQNKEESLAVEQLMKEYYLTANLIKELSEIIIERCFYGRSKKVAFGFISKRKLSHGFMIFRGELTITDKDLFKKDPLSIMRLFEFSQLHGVPINPFARECLRGNLDLIDNNFRNSPEAGVIFRNILKGEWDVAGCLTLMHKLEVLDRYLPRFGDVKCQVQHDVYHIYTVDIHSLFAVKELRMLSTGDYQERYPLTSALMREIEKPEVLYMAALWHDVGKGRGGKHEELGANIAKKEGKRIGFSKKEVEDICFLVLKHLRLSHTAQRRDLNDPELILDFAKEVGDLERLKMLYLLTFADIRAIGPDVWTNWKGALFWELYTKAAEVFETETFEIEDTKERIRQIKKDVRKLVSGEYPLQDVNAFLKSMHARYFLSNTPTIIAEHLSVAMRFAEPLCLDTKDVERRRSTRLIVITLDSPGLFSNITGVLSANNLNIMSAQVFTRTGGEVLDVFQVTDASGGMVKDRRKWEKVETDLRDVIQGVRKVDSFMKKEGPSILTSKYTPKVKTRVFVNNDISQSNTVIEVFAEDRIGLLHVIAKALTDLGLYIDISKISTMGEQATDVFYVKDIFGQKIYHREKLDEIRDKLLEAVGG